MTIFSGAATKKGKKGATEQLRRSVCDSGAPICPTLTLLSLSLQAPLHDLVEQRYQHLRRTCRTRFPGAAGVVEANFLENGEKIGLALIG